MCCSVLQYVVIPESDCALLQHARSCCALPTEYAYFEEVFLLQSTAGRCSALQSGCATCCSVVQCVAVRCSALQCSCTTLDLCCALPVEHAHWCVTGVLQVCCKRVASVLQWGVVVVCCSTLQ